MRLTRLGWCFSLLLSGLLLICKLDSGIIQCIHRISTGGLNKDVSMLYYNVREVAISYDGSLAISFDSTHDFLPHGLKFILDGFEGVNNGGIITSAFASTLAVVYC